MLASWPLRNNNNVFDHNFFLNFEVKRQKDESNTRHGHQAWGDLYCINYTAAKFKIFCYFAFSKLREILGGVEAFIETAESTKL